MKQSLRSDWSGAVLVCGKCSKKLGGGFGVKGKTPLAKVLRKLPGLGKGRRAGLGVVETKCLGVCPKNAVMLVDTRRPEAWRLVRPGDDVDAVVAALVNQAA